ncbi:ankyrin repeat family protein [Flamingopox virus FGPVKD09]|uniref:Ankyrin repeat family protein n=1 Tax=Flamingopox virus FGPVKD09 TaxID=2059380 RepID=A0A2H4X2R5_9POXV|nr:ankyrin repeat family protein [Flamingopox virus FGPVKD09]AUD40348.1 ankyrin repeat family protein [Flamingopox virus FGPVKD09]
MGNSTSLLQRLLNTFIMAMQEPKVTKETMLKIAIDKQYVNVVEYLIRKRVNIVNCRNSYNPLISAIKTENEEMVNLLILNGASVNELSQTNNTPLHIAVEKGNTRIVKVLLENGSDPNATDINKYTPLHVAMNNNKINSEIIELLLQYGADIDARDKYRNTPFAICMGRNFPKDSKELILSYFMI